MQHGMMNQGMNRVSSAQDSQSDRSAELHEVDITAGDENLNDQPSMCETLGNQVWHLVLGTHWNLPLAHRPCVLLQ